MIGAAILSAALALPFLAKNLTLSAKNPAPSAKNLTLSDFNPWLWPHEQPFYDLTVSAVLNGGSDFSTWRASFAPTYKAMVESSVMSAPSSAVLGAPIVKTGYTLTEIDFPFPSGPTIGTLLAVPDTIDPKKPVIIAISGHEVPERGTTPWSNFKPGYWPEQWAQAGYVVFSPSHIWMSQLGVYATQGISYGMTWVMMLSRLIDAVQPNLPAHNGMVATGLSSGGFSGAFLMAYRSDIKAGAFAGSLVGLDFLRENYRSGGWPNDWDVKNLFDFMPIYALIAPRPVQWQQGRLDPFYPTTLPVGNYGKPNFPGMPRPNSVQNFLGEWFVIQRIWQNQGGAPDLHLHDGGHVYDFDAAKAFIQTR